MPDDTIPHIMVSPLSRLRQSCTSHTRIAKESLCSTTRCPSARVLSYILQRTTIRVAMSSSSCTKSSAGNHQQQYNQSPDHPRPQPQASTRPPISFIDRRWSRCSRHGLVVRLFTRSAHVSAVHWQVLRRSRACAGTQVDFASSGVVGSIERECSSAASSESEDSICMCNDLHEMEWKQKARECHDIAAEGYWEGVVGTRDLR